MTVPLDRLYHYIESVAQDIRGDTVVIYRFFPHGAKKLDDICPLRNYSEFPRLISPTIYCNDQEPLNYAYYQAEAEVRKHGKHNRVFHLAGIDPPNTNLRIASTTNDKTLLLHSEQRSSNLTQYKDNKFIPVYYWSHAIIAQDWFRFGQHIKQQKNITSTFLIYNRAWCGTREYRLKFIDLLIDFDLQNSCQTTVNAIEPETGQHYSDYQFINPVWMPAQSIEEYFTPTTASSCASADFDLDDYNNTLVEVVLETLFDDDRLHLTEKTLRPIAVGQPFVLVATHGSLEYLRSYGFKTFSSIWDESYDTIVDPLERLKSIVNTMKQISLWSEEDKIKNIALMKEITDFNKAHFYSKTFTDLVTTELKTNLKNALDELENSNTGNTINWRKQIAQHPTCRDIIVGKHPEFQMLSRAEIAKIVYRLRQYYIRSLSSK